LKKSILFIINPISGGKSKSNFPGLANKHLNHSIFNARFVFTERSGHARELALENADTDVIVAVGGDGTINEVASALEGTGRCMGIIPYGSGNGLARAMAIPLKDTDAVRRLNNLNATQIDSGTLNGYKFFNMAGVGFDAHISKRFAKHTERGFGGYVQTTFREISAYKSQRYLLNIDGKVYERDAFMISIANSSQYGNNAHISPFASVRDGLLDVCIIKPFPLYIFPVIGLRMFSKTTHRSRFVEIIKGREIRIFREREEAVHLDGEPLLMEARLDIRVNPLSLRLLV
jgi:diacylglycerol kinase (ATP)